MGIPVVLVYLGFLKANEMKDRGEPFTSHEQWKQLVEAQSLALFPSAVWEKAWDRKNTRLILLLRSETQNLPNQTGGPEKVLSSSISGAGILMEDVRKWNAQVDQRIKSLEPIKPGFEAA